MKQGSTVTNNVQNKSYSGVKSHVDHKKYDRNGNEINHSNKDIDFERTKFNEEILDENIDPIREELFKDDFEDFNKMKIKNGRRKETRKNVKDFVQHKNGVFNKSGVLTFGTMEDWVDFNNNLDRNKADELNNTFRDWVENFNHKFKYLQITKAKTNLDESTPHLHYELISKATGGKKNKRSLSLNVALKKEFEWQTNKKAPRDNRATMTWFRDETDNMLIESANRFFGPQEEKEFFLLRTGNHKAKDQKIFKEIKIKEKQIENKNRQLDEKLQGFNQYEKDKNKSFNEKKKRFEKDIEEKRLRLKKRKENLKKYTYVLKINDYYNELVPNSKKGAYLSDNPDHGLKTFTGFKLFMKKPKSWLKEKSNVIKNMFSNHINRLKNDFENEKKKDICEIIKSYNPEARVVYKQSESGKPLLTGQPIKQQDGFNEFMEVPIEKLKKLKDENKKYFLLKTEKTKKDIDELKQEFNNQNLSVDDYRNKLNKINRTSIVTKTKLNMQKPTKKQEKGRSM